MVYKLYKPLATAAHIGKKYRLRTSHFRFLAKTPIKRDEEHLNRATLIAIVFL
jgi:hypothetical protein